MDTINPSDKSPAASNTPEASQDGPTLFDIWKSYEKIAMHFNELIIKMRVQALGGVAAIAAIAGIVLKESEDGQLQWKLLGVAFLALTPFWGAVWALDFLYYTPLLYGAVAAIRELERQSASHTKWKAIDLSTRIEDLLEGRVSGSNRWRSLRGPLWFYSLVMVGLLLLSILSFIMSGYENRVPSSGAPASQATSAVPQSVSAPTSKKVP